MGRLSFGVGAPLEHEVTTPNVEIITLGSIFNILLLKN